MHYKTVHHIDMADDVKEVKLADVRKEGKQTVMYIGAVLTDEAAERINTQSPHLRLHITNGVNHYEYPVKPVEDGATDEMAAVDAGLSKRSKKAATAPTSDASTTSSDVKE